MTIYILKHPESGFTGFFGRVDFDNGMGSTSSQQDRDRLVNQFKCKDITEEYWSKKKKEESMKKKTEATAKKEEAKSTGKPKK